MLKDSYINSLTGGSDAATISTTSSEVVLFASQWEAIHAGAILMAGAAIKESSWAHLRQAEEIMSTAKAGFDPLVVAIMGVRAPDLTNRLISALHTAGQHATIDQIKAAQALIKANREQMDARKQKPAIQPVKLKAAVKPHHQAVVAWLAENGPAKVDAVALATGQEVRTIKAMVLDKVLWEDRRGRVGL